MTITGKQAFIEFLDTHPEKGIAYPDMQYNKLYDILPDAFNALTALQISFEEYQQFYLFLHPDTNELFLGDMNTGGHATRCRLLKVTREDLFTKQTELKRWYADWAWEMWRY